MEEMMVNSLTFFSYNVFKSFRLFRSFRLGLRGKYYHSLTHYQTTNFRLFQTERVCRRQFQISRKWQKVIQMGRKHCGKRRNCSLRAISPVPTVFSKGSFPRGCQKVSLCGNGLTHSLIHHFLAVPNSKKLADDN